MSFEPVASLLKAEYPDVKPGHVDWVDTIPSPSTELVHALDEAGQGWSIPPGFVDWATVLPKLLKAIGTGRWLSFIPTAIQLGSTVWTFMDRIRQEFEIQT